MSQIPLHHNSMNAAGSALSALGGPSSGTRKDSGRAQPTGAAGTGSFSHLLNQSAQHLQAQAPQVQPFTPPMPQPQAKPAVQPKTPSANAAASGNGAPAGASSTAQEENKLNARNAANRNSANKQAESKAPARPAQPQAEGADKAHAQQAKARGASADAADAAERPDAADAAAGKDEAAEATAKADGSDPAAAAQQMLAMLRGDLPQEAKLQLKDGAADGATDGHSAVGGHGKGGHHGAAGLDHDALQQQLEQGGHAPLDGKTEAGEGAEGLQALAGGSREIALGDGARAEGTHQSFEAMLAAAQQADAAGGAAGADAAGAAEAPSVPLSQPLDSPEFAPELSASVSLLIQDGVHEAQLQLNPTDMGPVAIQIQVDGQQAQVNFHAEQASTRDVLMRSMPDLAAALQSQGLTLSGGGVFAQAQSGNGQNGRGGDGDGTSRRGGRGGGQGDDGLTSVSRAPQRSQPRGLVDLYA